MIRATGKIFGEGFTTWELRSFPCTDLITIDQLWGKYSHGRFGFGVQTQILIECGAELDKKLGGGNYSDDKVWERFGDKVGWRIDENWIYYRRLKFSTSAPQGHLPYWQNGTWWLWGFAHRVGDDSYELSQFSALAWRFINCNA